MANVIALIGARSGSSMRDKNIRELGGHPLIAWSIRAALKTSGIDRVIVSTDSLEYADIAESYGAEVPILRPSEISGDNAIDQEFIVHMLDWIVENEPTSPDLIVHLRPTTPMRDPETISKAIRLMQMNLVNTSLRSVHEMPESAYKCFEIGSGILKSVYTQSHYLDYGNAPRQKYATTYQGNGYVDILKTSFIRQWQKEKRIHGYHVVPFITPRVIEIDTEEDFALVEYQVTRNPNIINQLFS